VEHPIVTGEVVENTRKRMVEYQFVDSRLLLWITFQASQRILNSDECIKPFIKPNDILKVVLPDRTRANDILKTGKEKKGADQPGNGGLLFF
jgi:hypothetical protein